MIIERTLLIRCICVSCVPVFFVLVVYLHTTSKPHQIFKSFYEILKLLVLPTPAPIWNLIYASLSVVNEFSPSPVTNHRSTDLVKLTATNNSYLFFFFFFTCVPHPEPSSLLPPHNIPLGHLSAPAPSIQHRALNLDWHLVSYMTFHMFQCHSPKSSHPLPLPQSP